MTELLEEKGLKVMIEDLPERVSGFTCLIRRTGDKPELPVVVVNRQFSLERRRMTLAHRIIEPEHLTEQEEEKAATYFTGAFLMPRDHLEREVGEHRHNLGYKELIDIKRLYRVSCAALLVRMKELGIVSEAFLVYAFRAIAHGWRIQEPEELELPNERGSREKLYRFERLCYRALAEKLISLPKAAELLRVSIDEVERGLKEPGLADADYRQ